MAEEKKSEKSNNKTHKRLSMEEKTPTMPCFVFLKNLKITGTGEDSQGKFEYSECKDVKKEIAEKYNMSASAFERQLHRSHEKLLREQLNYPCPIVLGIDEHSIHRGNTKGHKFAVTLTGLRTHRVYEGFEGKEGCRGGAGQFQSRWRERLLQMA